MHRGSMLDMPCDSMYDVHMADKNYFINGVPELLVLRLLSQQEMYGYQLVAAIRERSSETFQFGEGCLYPILHRLAADGQLNSRREVVDGRARHYYRTSAKGRKYLEKLTAEWATVVRGAEAILEGSYVR